MQDHDLIENVKQVVNEVKAGYLNKKNRKKILKMRFKKN